jgi:hypothetical protein
MVHVFVLTSALLLRAPRHYILKYVYFRPRWTWRRQTPSTQT